MPPELPDDVLESVVRWADWPTLCRARATCRAMRAASEPPRAAMMRAWAARRDDYDLRWALTHACRTGRTTVARIVVSALQSRNAQDPKAGTAVWYRDKYLRDQIDSLLRETVEDHQGHVGIAEALLSAGANPNQTLLSAPEKCGVTLLHRASARGLDVVVKALIDAGADVEARDLYGNRYVDVQNVMGGKGRGFFVPPMVEYRDPHYGDIMVTACAGMFNS